MVRKAALEMTPEELVRLSRMLLRRAEDLQEASEESRIRQAHSLREEICELAARIERGADPYGGKGEMDE